MRESITLINSVDGDSSGADYLHFRELVIGPEREELDALKKHVKVMDAQLEKRVSDVMPKALAAWLKGHRVAEDEMGELLHGSVESALRISVARDRSKLTNALFPVMGAAIRDYVRNLFQTKMEELNALIRNTTSVKRLKWKAQALLTGKPFS
jgi:hypothetical protein